MDHKEFLESMSSCDRLVDHEDNCGQCEHQRIMAQVARELLEAKNYSIHAWDEEARRRWQETKYYKLWQEEDKVGRNPHDEFAKRGWEP